MAINILDISGHARAANHYTIPNSAPTEVYKSNLFHCTHNYERKKQFYWFTII